MSADFYMGALFGFAICNSIWLIAGIVRDRLTDRHRREEHEKFKGRPPYATLMNIGESKREGH